MPTNASDKDRPPPTLPDTLQGVIASRVDTLRPATQMTLKVASVVGRTFLYRMLREVHPRQEDDELRVELEQLLQRDFTLLERIEPELAYLFKHVITQDV